MGFTSIYLGGTFAILGINPVRKYREMQEESKQLAEDMKLIPLKGDANRLPTDQMTNGQLKMI